MLLATLPALVVVGLAARTGLPGGAGDAAGGMLYAALVYVLAGLAAPGRRPAQLALAAFAISAAVELLQLTPVPANLGDALPPLRFVLGSTFVATDLLAYAAGALAAATVDRTVVARRQSRAGQH